MKDKIVETRYTVSGIKPQTPKGAYGSMQMYAMNEAGFKINF